MKVCRVQFKRVGKKYFFNPNGIPVTDGTFVVVETVRGVEIGKVVGDLTEAELDPSLEIKPIIRIATKKDEIKITVIATGFSSAPAEREVKMEKVQFEGGLPAYSFSGTPADCVKYAILSIYGNHSVWRITIIINTIRISSRQLT